MVHFFTFVIEDYFFQRWYYVSRQESTWTYCMMSADDIAWLKFQWVNLLEGIWVCVQDDFVKEQNSIFSSFYPKPNFI